MSRSGVGSWQRGREGLISPLPLQTPGPPLLLFLVESPVPQKQHFRGHLGLQQEVEVQVSWRKSFLSVEVLYGTPNPRAIIWNKGNLAGMWRLFSTSDLVWPLLWALVERKKEFCCISKFLQPFEYLWVTKMSSNLAVCFIGANLG